MTPIARHMTPMVALLRGINVGGSGKLPMTQLREVAESIGLHRVRTYIQSGNLVFAEAVRPTSEVAVALRAAIGAATDLDPEVIVRTHAELAEVVGADPFLQRGEDPASLHVRFFADEAASLLDGLDIDGFGPEEAIPIRRELHLFLPGGMGRSKLAVALDRHLRRVGTVRSWRTVTTLLEMASEVD